MLLNEEKISFDEYENTGYKVTADEINKKYEKGELRIVTEQGRYGMTPQQ